MTDDVIDFAKAKADIDREKSHHIVSLDLYLNSDNSQPWASVTNIDEADIDPDWHRFIAAQLRQLAYIGEGMAAQDEGTKTAPVVAISIFEDSRISVIDNEDMIQTEEQLKWVEEQLMNGVDEIRKKLNPT